MLGEDGRLRPVKGEQEVLDMFSAFKEASGQWGTVTEIRGVSLWRLFLTLYGQQRGGSMFSEDGTELTLDDDKALRSLEFMQQLGSGRKLMPTDLDYPASVANFSNRLTGTMLQGEWEVTTFQAAKLPFDMTPVPNIMGEPVSQADVACVRRPEVVRAPRRAPRRGAHVRRRDARVLLHLGAGRPCPGLAPGARERRVPQARAAVALRGGRGADGRRPARVVLRLRLRPRERGLGLLPRRDDRRQHAAGGP